ncbi:MAG: hypothetical protein V4808_07110 [Pseudomonadota bacterium]
MHARALTEQLKSLLGEAAFVALAEAFGGTRLYVPHTIPADHEIARAIGIEAAARLSKRLAPDTIRMPLARELRARHYRAHNLSNAAIARKLGLTEGGVEKLFKRMDNPPAKGSAGQLHLFER